VRAIGGVNKVKGVSNEVVFGRGLGREQGRVVGHASVRTTNGSISQPEREALETKKSQIVVLCNGAGRGGHAGQTVRSRSGKETRPYGLNHIQVDQSVRRNVRGLISAGLGESECVDVQDSSIPHQVGLTKA